MISEMIFVLIVVVRVVLREVGVRRRLGKLQPIQPLENSHLDHVLQQQILTVQQTVID